MQNDPWEKEIKSGVRCMGYLLNIDPRQGYGSRGLHAVRGELQAKFAGLKKDPRWKYTCRRCRKKKQP